MSVPGALVVDFRELFQGYDQAFGTGRGGWVKRPLRVTDFVEHLAGRGSGIGIGPLMPDNRVWFAAIDLDEPNFALAAEMQEFIPGRSWVERTRSGNVHVWVFFSEPIEAWIAMGILREVCIAVGRKHTEVFPKAHDFARVARGSYINLPYHGSERPILWHAGAANETTYTAENFVQEALASRNDPRKWRQRASLLLLTDPATQRRDSQAEFGTQRSLHMCAEYVVDGVMSGERPITQGHKSVVYFNLAKQFANCELWSKDEAWETFQAMAAASDDPPNMSEVRRFLRNAYDKQYTSTGCDDPVFAPYAHPNCPIAHGG